MLAACAATLLLAGCGGSDHDHVTASTPYDPTLAAALPADVRAARELRIGTDASYAPASSFAADGRTIIGFEPDLATALGRVLGVNVRFEQVPFERLLDRLNRRRLDVVMSAMTDTRERERRADFVDYFAAGSSIVVQRGNPRGISDLASLCGRRVAVERGTIQVDLLARSARNCARGRTIAVKAFATNADALVQLRTGRVDAVLNDYPPAAHLARDPRTRGRYQLASTAQYEPGLYGMAVNKDRPRLRDAIHGALDRVI